MIRNKGFMINIFGLLRMPFALLFSGVLYVSAQDGNTIPDNWHLLDFEENGVYGISMEKAYSELLNGRKPDTVIVAIIDSGIDTLHTDIKGVLWRNTAEQGNDEDNNGYVGDRYGWNFLGGKGGRSLEAPPLEFMRQYFRLKNKYERKKIGNVRKKQQQEYRLWQQVRDKFRGDSLELVNYYRAAFKELQEGDLRIRETLDRQKYTASNLSALDETLVGEGNRMFRKLTSRLTKESTTNIEVLNDWQNRLIEVERNPRFSYGAYAPKANLRREVIGDDYYNFKDRYYGNPLVGTGSHGTLVAGVIGAIRDNAKGINGVANAVKLMSIKAVPKEGDEYDKDIALAIRYAVDNGAKVINMSFAKDFSPEQRWVEQAIRYAKRKDVLLVQAAGNDGRNIDAIPKYPSSKPLNNKQKRFPNMINVGASGPTTPNLIADFSNYGKNMVDVFAPGLEINSTSVGGGCVKQSGTSMASPVVAGIAAVLRSYFPGLSAIEVKQIIETSVTRIDGPVRKPGLKFEDKQKKELVNMAQLCKTGGIANAYKAIELAIYQSEH